MTSPILKQIGTVFVPVSDIKKARDWYSRLLGLASDGEIQFGHLFVIHMCNGTNLVLDSKIYSPETVLKAPIFHLNTENIEEAYRFMQENNVELLSEIQHNHFFNIKDCDGNVIMICKC